MTRLSPTFRLYLIRPAGYFGSAWGIVACSFAVNLVVWWAARLGSVDGASTGGLAAFYITVFAVFVTAVVQLWPFAASLGVSRRTFLAASLALAGVQAVVYGAVLAALVAIENATDGWGVGLSFWAPGGMDVGNPVLQVLVSGAPILAAAALGLVVGTVYKRWGQPGVYGFGVAVLALGGAALAVPARAGSWEGVWRWFTDQSAVTLAAVLPASTAALLAGLAFALLRRTAP